MAKMTGVERHLRKLRALRDIETPVIQSMLESGELVRQEAMRSIRDGTIRGPGHIPSRPGEPPKGDTGELELGIVVRLRATEKRVEVASTAPFSAELELGSAHVLERPFMRPALARYRSSTVIGVVHSVNDVLRRTKG